MSSVVGQTPEVVNVPDFWARLQESGHKFLALDYDGTLAPFHVERMQALPLPGIRSLLKTLSEREDTTVVIISGRPVAEILNLLGDFQLTLVGGHGREIRQAQGQVSVTEPTREQAEGLTTAREIARQQGFGGNLEAKMASIALHTRGLATGRAEHMEGLLCEKWTLIADRYGLQCLRFNGGVEIRCLGRHKGDVLRELLDQQPEGTFSVYIGDDLTDEDAFGAITGRGVGIKVAKSNTKTKATGFLADCEEVRAFLETWCSVTSSD